MGRRGMQCLLVCLATQMVSAQDVLPVPPLRPIPSAALLPPPRNLHVVTTEDFLNRVVTRCDVKPGKVQEVFQGSPISGDQVTSTRLTVDLRPSSSTGRILAVLEGETSSSTAGFTPQAIVNSVGRQNFCATKEILFDGYELATRHAHVSAHAESQNVGAVTPFTGRPLGPLVEQVVLGIAQQRQPAAQEFARQRVVERVYPEFDSEVDAQLAKGNQFLKDRLQSRLKAAKLLPESLQVRTTDTHLHLAASVAVPLDVSELIPAPDQLVESHELSIYVHESLFQGLIERAALAGTQMSSRDLKDMLQQLGLDEESSPDGLAGMDVEIQFADDDPVRVEIVDDETRVTVRAAFLLAGQDSLPQFEITVPVRLVLVAEQWQLRLGPVKVRSRIAGADGTSIAEIAVKKVIEARLPGRKFPQQLPAAFWPEGKTPPKLTSIRSAAGWLVIGLD